MPYHQLDRVIGKTPTSPCCDARIYLMYELSIRMDVEDFDNEGMAEYGEKQEGDADNQAYYCDKCQSPLARNDTELRKSLGMT